MANIPKPQLERGNYLAYADKPGIVIGDGNGDYAVYASNPRTIAD